LGQQKLVLIAPIDKADKRILKVLENKGIEVLIRDVI